VGQTDRHSLAIVCIDFSSDLLFMWMSASPLVEMCQPTTYTHTYIHSAPSPGVPKVNSVWRYWQEFQHWRKFSQPLQQEFHTFHILKVTEI
jgi:hypothetical protein